MPDCLDFICNSIGTIMACGIRMCNTIQAIDLPTSQINVHKKGENQTICR